MLPCDILVVEDESMIQAYLVQLLQRMGLNVTAAVSSGEEAVQTALEKRPDLILMDIMLQGSMNGIEATRRIHEKADIPVIFLTAYADGPIIQQAVETSPHGYITKPCKDRDLYSAIQLALFRHEFERRLKASEEKFRSLFEDVPDAILITSPEGRLLDVNPAGIALFGYQNRETMMRDFDASRHYSSPEERAGFLAEMEARRNVRNFPSSLHRPDGEVRFILESSSAECDSEGRIVAYRGILHDVTEREEREHQLERMIHELAETNRRLQESQSMLLQQEKLASIGQLAAGVAHELNNPIGFVSSNMTSLQSYSNTLKKYIEKLEEALGQLPDLTLVEKQGQEAAAFRREKKISFILTDMEDLLKESLEGIERVTIIVRNLRNFSRVDFDDTMKPYDLREGVESTLVVARNEVKYVADVETDLGEIPDIPCIAGEINQVILNIIVNAAQAIKEKQPPERGRIRIRTWHDGCWVYCRISDNGPGISQENLNRIFDPFFTTKEVGKGTGLGLSISYNIVVTKHKGRLDVESQPGEGVAFTIALPISPPPVE